jgi:hypothetical protein
MTEYTKGMKPINADYAKGGGIFSSRSRFMKAPDPFREDKQRSDYEKKCKGGEMAQTEGETKKLKAVKPRG